MTLIWLPFSLARCSVWLREQLFKSHEVGPQFLDLCLRQALFAVLTQRLEAFEFRYAVKRLHETLFNQVALDHGARVFDKAIKSLPCWFWVAFPLHFELNLFFISKFCNSMPNNAFHLVPAALSWLFWSGFWALHLFVCELLNKLFLFVCLVSLWASLCDRFVEVEGVD